MVLQTPRINTSLESIFIFYDNTNKIREYKILKAQKIRKLKMLKPHKQTKP
jgi:hypothetical protein